MPNSTNVPLSPNPTLLNLWEKELKEEKRDFFGRKENIMRIETGTFQYAASWAKGWHHEKYITPLLKEVEELKKENERLKAKINK